MIWRSICISSHHRPSCLTTCSTWLRHSSSGLRASDSSIANILALPSSATDGLHREITAIGSVRTVRKQKHRAFVEIGDGSTINTLQAVLEPSQAEGLGTGTSVAISGTWQPSPPGKEQNHELKAKDIRIVGLADAERYPIQKKFHSAEFLRRIPHLRLRTPSNALLARIRSDCDLFISQFLHERDFVRLQPPIITSSDCEGAGDVFTVSSHTTAPHLSGLDEEPFFREPKFLTVSSQLHLEAFVHEHPKVWTLSPTFRAERSDTPRHVSEFWMLEVEVRTESLPDVMDIVEDMIRSLVSNLQKSKLLEQLLSIKQRGEPGDNGNFPSTSDLILERWDGLTQRRWPRITYNEAMDLLHKAVLANEFFFHHKPSWGAGLQLEHEKFIAAEVGYGSPVFVTHYPQSIKPFYMLPSKVCNTEVSGTDGRDTAACFDLLLPESCEVVGGSLREHRLHDLIQSMHKDGLKVSTERERFQGDGQPGVSSSTKAGSLEWYVDLRRYGSIPHGGFGLGFDRLLGYLAGMRNIKDVIPWPRYHGRCDC